MSHTIDQDQAERRQSSRFPVVRAVRFKMMSGGSATESGRGHTVNISSTGALFTTERQLASGKWIELSISWPAQLDGICPLQLVAEGCVVRTEPGKAALEFQRCEFRTVGANAFTS